MEVVGELISTVNELKGELAKAQQTIAEKDAEVKRLLEEVVVLKQRLQMVGDADVREPEASPILERKSEEIIPKECWALVFQNLNAEDLLSCRQVCKSFNQLLDLKEFKEKWKFKLILPLLFTYLKTGDLDRRTWENLYSARLTCKSWCHWIDKYASEFHGAHTFFLPTYDMPLLTSFENSEEIEEFQDKFGESDTNPFPSRSLYIRNPVEQVLGLEGYGYAQDYYSAQKRLQDEFIENVGELLEQFGKHIFKLRLCFQHKQIFGPGPDPVTLCQLINGVTIHLPNLKELLILIKRCEPEDQDDEELDEEVASYIAENALVPLPKLRALCIGGLDKKIEDYLLDAFSPQLTHLETRFSENVLSQLQLRQLKNVRKLWLLLDKPTDTLQSLQFLQSPLKLLKLTGKFGSARESWNLDELLRNLKHLPIELLEIHLRIRLPVNLAEAGIDIEEYNNSSIKTLIIHINQIKSAAGKISFNFLLALPKLENLEFKFSRPQFRTTHPEELPELVKLNKYLFGEIGTNLPYHSNVWEKVPSLKTLTVRRKDEGDELVKSIYTREKYERITPKGTVQGEIKLKSEI